MHQRKESPFVGPTSFFFTHVDRLANFASHFKLTCALHKFGVNKILNPFRFSFFSSSLFLVLLLSSLVVFGPSLHLTPSTFTFFIFFSFFPFSQLSFLIFLSFDPFLHMTPTLKWVIDLEILAFSYHEKFEPTNLMRLKNLILNL